MLVVNYKISCAVFAAESVKARPYHKMCYTYYRSALAGILVLYHPHLKFIQIGPIHVVLV